MRERFTLQYRGKRYVVERGQRPSTSARGAGGPVGRNHWYLTVGGTALTSLEARPRETDEELKARVRAWLDAHPELHNRDQIHLGGG
jgi:hypothetical protein